MKIISIVIPVYNERSCIAKNLTVISDALESLKSRGYSPEYVIVDDGSTDGTLEALKTHQLSNTRCIAFTRNFGKEAAILAGLRHCSGDAAIVMDSDLQHPPSIIVDMVAEWTNGALVVNACKRNRGDENVIYKLCSKAFYSVFRRLTRIDIEGHSDYKLLDRLVIDQYCLLEEKGRFFRASIADMGFRSTNIYFDVNDRAGGQSSWSVRSLFSYSINGIANFTSLPLHIISFVAFFLFCVSLVLMTVTAIQFSTGRALEGFSTVIILQLLIGSSIMFSLGQIGIYLEKIFDEVKRRPDYLIDNDRSLNIENKGDA